MERKEIVKRLKKKHLENCPYTKHDTKRKNADAMLRALDGYADVWRDFVRLVMTDEKIPMPLANRRDWYLFPPRVLSWGRVRACIAHPFKQVTVSVLGQVRYEDAYDAYKVVKQELEKD